MGQARKDTGKWQIALHRYFSDAPSLGRDEELRERTDVPGEHISYLCKCHLVGT